MVTKSPAKRPQLRAQHIDSLLAVMRRAQILRYRMEDYLGQPLTVLVSNNDCCVFDKSGQCLACGIPHDIDGKKRQVNPPS